MSLAVPVGICPTTIGVSAAWWLHAARRAEEAGVAFVGAWDHLMSRGDPRSAVLECWSLLSAAAATTRRVRLGSYVTNALLRHPAVLARTLATLADVSAGRVELGIGSGGFRREVEAYGIAFPAPAERLARLEESVTVIRSLLGGGPADLEGRFFHLRGAYAHPVPTAMPRIMLAGGTPAAARLAARIGDAWTCPGDRLDSVAPAFREALVTAGREPSDVPVVVGVHVEEVMPDPAGASAAWQERGADELVVHWVRPSQLDGLLAALARAT